jgi:hypothetical protein
MWQDSVESNQAARMAARQQGDIGEELHAMDYMVYASLQQGHDAEASAIIQDLRGMTRLTAGDFKVSYAATAMPVRYAVERKHWDEATRSSSPEGAPPHVTALAAWARALGYARSGNRAAAEAELQSLERLTDQLRAAGNQYWAGQVQIQAEEASSWIALAAHKPDDALALMKKAADEEDAVEKLPVTPGPVVPAREQLGDMLTLVGQPAAALAEYERTLRDSPGRRGALQGALSSAREAGLKAKSAYYEAAIKNLE